MRTKLHLWALCVVVISAAPALAQQGDLAVDRIFIPSVTLTDPQLIRFFLNELLISEDDVRRIDILDVSQNGFGVKDLVRTYPSGELYFIFPSDTIQKIMDKWEFKANFQIVAETGDTTSYRTKQDKGPEWRIMSSLLEALEQNYTGTAMKLRLERTSSDVVFEMWGYDMDRLVRERPAADDSQFDILLVYKTVVDTVYVAVPGGQSRR
jgi:hypothetical protein